MKSKLLGLRKPTKEEKKKGAEIVFLREDKNGNIVTIYGCKCYESFEQWGAETKILGDNVEDIENWRKQKNNL